MTEFTMIKYEMAGHVAVITLNRPERLNAILYPMIKEFVVAMDRAVEEGARALVVTGAGRAFSAGGDLIGRDDIHDTGKPLEDFWNAFAEKLICLPIPVVTAINGVAAGAAVSIGLSADFIIMEESSYFQLAFLKVGLHPDGGAVWLLSRLVSRQRATEILMLSEKLSARKAEEWGMIYKVVEDGTSLATAMELAGRLAKGPTKAYALLRRTLVETYDGTLTSSLHLERLAQQIAGASSDFQEGLDAFRERREPKFIGR
ncbi:MAG: 2-(1,2-epoxy-1,2-dihydrophenyl)acetyl-CoA isomerase [Sphingomonadales bacterium]|nr:MAG: 2-(1,2-epoxy-1,2-dihydrophenyl)acetyl-CoA isomerase [Sphingomonadales bacterium]